MNTSRKFEVQKKKLAVRRLSQGSRPNLQSPQGDGKFRFKPRFSPEEYSERRRKLPQRSLKGPQNLGRMVRGDLRGKLQNRNENFEQPSGQEQRDVQSYRGQRGNTSDDVHPTKPVFSNPMGISASNVKLNPFAAMLEAKKGTSLPKADEKPKILFGPAQDKQPLASTFAMDSYSDSASILNPKQENIAIPSIKADVFQGTATDINPFLMALKEKTTTATPNAANLNPSSASAIVPFSVPKIPQPEPPQNPFSFKLKEFSPKKGNFTLDENKAFIAVSSEDPIASSSESAFMKEKLLVEELTSLKLIGVPEEFNNKDFLRNFYEKFGTVKRVYSHPVSNSAIITFIDHDSAARAKLNGAVLTEDGVKVSIFWSKTKSSKAASNEDKEMQDTSSESQGNKLTEVKVPKLLQNLEPTTQKRDVFRSQKKTFVVMLENFVNTLKSVPARDAMEKGELLEKIDQKIREGMERETDLKKALHSIGTCPDMCPEKERYLREHRQRLATYELQTGADEGSKGGQFPLTDPSKVVKEYSRSSADQEKPLPHELRPGHVLQLTMNYLMLNIMDSGERNSADWYDFVWNRTRGIRKDITQQHLCDESSVDLIEKCTRFHIICSHHLCEEDINVFDSKINNEHLTKCLQSLKHMYDDLYLQKGIACPNEAEFRCYQILLNLNNGDILREVTEFRPEVRESQEVKFALEVLRALNSTNYVRFFKLLHTGSYLMACIMQRYFNQIRSKGLFIMNKAYTTTGVKAVPVPLSDIARLFAIDELDEASEFCEHYGFQIDDGLVYFSKSSYEEPESNFPPVRNGFIDKKRTSSFGEVVNGRPLSRQIDYVPTNSFDENGYYNGTYHTLALKGICSDSDKNDGKTEPIIEKTVQVPMRVEKDDIKAMCVGLIVSVVNKEVFKVCTEVMEDVKEAVMVANEAAADVIDKAVTAEVKTCLETEIEKESFEKLSCDVFEDISTVVIDEQVKKIIMEEFEAERKKKEHEKRMQLFHLATEMSRDILWAAVESNTKDVLHEVIRLEREEKQMQLITQGCAIVGREYLEGFLVKEIRKVCEEAHLLEIKSRKESLDKIKHKVVIRRTRKVFKQWMKERETRIQIREILQNFPACSNFQSSPEIMRSLTRHMGHASQLPNYVTLTNNAELTVSSVSNIAKRRDRHRDAIEKYHQQIVNERQELKKPLDFNSVLHFMAKFMKTKSKSSFISKIMLCFPESKAMSPTNALDVEVIKEKFRMKDFDSRAAENVDMPWMEDFCQLSASVPQGSISLSIKGIHLNCKEIERNATKISKQVYGVTGYVFILEMQKINWHAQRQKMKDVLALKPESPTTPILIVGLESSYCKREIKDYLELERFKENGEISSYEILLLESTTEGAQLHEELFASLLILISETPEPPNLQSSSLPNLLEDALQLNFFEGIYDGRDHQKDVRSAVLNPRPIAELYNAVLDHVINICTTEKLSKFSWPSMEMLQQNRKLFPDLTWNDQTSFEQIKDVINSLRLPTFDDEINKDGEWDEQARYCLEYLQHIVQNAKLNLHSSELISRVECIINQYLHKWKYRSRTSSIPFPWSLILEECVHVLLASVHRPQSDVVIPRLVCFFKKDFYRFRPPKSWIEEIKYIKEISRENDALGSSTLDVSSRDEYIQKGLRELNEDFSYIENTLLESQLEDTQSSGAIDELLKRQKELDESLWEENVALSRMSDFCTNAVDELSQIPSGSKRKRLSTEDPMKKQSEKENNMRQLDTEGKRPKKFIESRIDDLLNEVKFMRSKFDLDEMRYRQMFES